jgi:hypothetical protein
MKTRILKITKKKFKQEKRKKSEKFEMLKK